MKTVTSMADLKEQEGAANAPVWQWLSSMVEKLGKDGMSSEESDTDTHGSSIEPVCRTRVMKWRRKIESELQVIDDQRYLDDNIFAHGGSKPVMRILGFQNKPSARPPVPGLPCSFYDDEWLQQQMVHYVKRTLKILNEKFKWIHVEAKKTW